MTSTRSLLAALALSLTWTSVTAAVIETTGTWSGMNVTLATPAEKITFATPFGISFRVDSSPLGANADPRAFLSTIVFSNTVDLAAAQWTYTLASDDPGFNVTRSGSVGDAFAPVDGSFRLRLVDPFFVDPDFNQDGYSFLDGGFNDRIEWSLSNIIIAGNTDVTLLIDDDGITGATALDAAALVIDPPAAGVAEPAPLALLLAAAAAFGLGGRRRLPAAVRG